MSRYKSELLSGGPWRDIWETVYKILEETTVTNQLAAWIQPLKLIELGAIPDAKEGDAQLSAVLIAPNDFSASWVNTHLSAPLSEAFNRATGSKVKIQVVTAQSGSEAIESGSVSSGFESFSTEGSSAELFPSAVTEEDERRAHYELRVESPVIQSGYREKEKELNLDEFYTFESFVVGSSNQFAHASAMAVSDNPGRQYNPLFLYSPPGLGKTHLLHAIGNRVLKRNPETRVLYTSAEKFVNEVVDHILQKKMAAFHQRYREKFDVLLIDDIQFIAGKKQSEEEFFHTFNALYGTKRQIVVTSDRPPQELEVLEKRITTRFQCGLIVDIGSPEIETRIAILKTKATRDDIYLPDEVATFIATHVKSNVRELEGILIKLQAISSLTGAEISLEMAKQELSRYLPEEGAHFTVESIQNAVAKHFRLKIVDLKSTSRARKFAFPRQIGMYLVRKYTGMGYQEIGNHFGGKDHTTVLHGFQKIESEIESTVEVKSAVESIQNLL